MPLSRIAWITVSAICAAAAAILVLDGYTGYSLVVGAVGVSAAVNLL